MSTRSRPFAGTMRVVAVLTSLLACGATLVVRRVRAGSDELLQEAGTAMLTYARTQHIDAPRTLILNGVSLRLLSGSTHDSPETLLDTFHARCKQVGAHLDLDVRSLPKMHRAEVSTLPAFDGVLQRNNPKGGYLACIDAGGSLSLR